MSRHINTLSQLTDSYDAILCDVWGVLHNGIDPFPLAVQALIDARATATSVVMITNSPRPAEGVINQFGIIGVDRSAWDDIVTSGDVTRRLISEGPKKLFYIGPDRDRELADGLSVELVAEEDAEGVLCTGPFDDEIETPNDYAEMLARFKERNLPFLCANPDQVVERGDRLIYCAGSIATAYEKIGGETRIAGKPHRPIYEEALRRVELLRGTVDKARVLAIGDGIATDISGALNAEIDVLFIARGIHANQYYEDKRINEAKLNQFFARENTVPTLWSDWLK